MSIQCDQVVPSGERSQIAVIDRPPESIVSLVRIVSPANVQTPASSTLARISPYALVVERPHPQPAAGGCVRVPDQLEHLHPVLAHPHVDVVHQESTAGEPLVDVRTGDPHAVHRAAAGSPPSDQGLEPLDHSAPPRVS
jgi:hypothetical protein